MKSRTQGRPGNQPLEIAYRTRTKTHKKNQEEKLSLEPQRLGARAESSANEFPGGS
jgi:hypothetical protein